MADTLQSQLSRQQVQRAEDLARPRNFYVRRVPPVPPAEHTKGMQTVLDFALEPYTSRRAQTYRLRLPMLDGEAWYRAIPLISVRDTALEVAEALTVVSERQRLMLAAWHLVLCKQAVRRRPVVSRKRPWRRS